MRPAIDHHEIERSFLEFCESHGFSIPMPVQVDGKIHRFKLADAKRGSLDGAYCVWPNGLNHDNKPHGWVMNHKDGGAKYHWQYHSKDNPPKRELSATEQLAARERREQGAEQVRQERIDKLRAAWSSYGEGRSVEECVDHPYLSAKHCQPRGGFFFGGQFCGLHVGDMVSSTGKILSNLLLIPMIDLATNKFCSLHRVFGQAVDGKFNKGWYTLANGVFPVGLDAKRGPVFVGEGIGTMLSVYESWIENGTPETPGEFVNACTALACMDSNNLVKQAWVIRERFKDRRVLVVADDDEAGTKTADMCIKAGFDGVWHVEGGVA